MENHRNPRGPRLWGELLVRLVLVAVTAFLGYPLILHGGLPSFERGYFHSATIAYYIEWARELDSYGPFTPAWCGGFDLLRFYPPLGLVLLYTLGKLAGDIFYGAHLSFLVAVYVFAVGVYSLSRELGGGWLPGLVMALTAFSLSGYVSTIAVYWEYTRLLGEGLALLSLAHLNRALRDGGEGDALLAGLYAGLTLLTHLIASLELALLSTLTAAYWLGVHWRRGAEPPALGYLARLSARALFLALAISGWWLVPALAPFGVSHYLRVSRPPGLLGGILLDSLGPLPPLYEPAVQAPLLVLGVAGIALHLALKRPGLPALYALALALLVALYGQGPRLLPTLTLLALMAWVQAWGGVGRRGVGVLTLAVLATPYLALYTPVYHDGLKTDYTYINSDEFLLSNYLASATPEGDRVYVMYGPRLHGNQWINAFQPRLWQVLSGYEEGCMLKEPLELDRLIKESANTRRTAELLDSLRVDYVAVDRAWYESNPNNVVKLLVDKGVLVEDNFTHNLRYTLLFRVKHEGPRAREAGNGGPSIIEFALLPSRVLGVISSIASYNAYSRLGEHGPSRGRRSWAGVSPWR